jgi:hypothetical protein
MVNVTLGFIDVILFRLVCASHQSNDRPTAFNYRCTPSAVRITNAEVSKNEGMARPKATSQYAEGVKYLSPG